MLDAIQLVLCFYSSSVNEPSLFGRSLIVNSAPKFLVNQPDLRQDIIHILQRRSRDTETTIRFGVVKVISKATKKNLDILHHSALLDILKDSFCDRSVSNFHTSSVFMH
jgi:hypothetical protein